MEIIWMLDLDIVAIIGLTLLLIYGNKELTTRKKEYKLYRDLIKTTLPMLVFEIDESNQYARGALFFLPILF